MKKSITKSILIFLSIPLINSLAFGIGTLFFEMHRSTISHEQFQSYKISMLLMISILILAIPFIEGLFDTNKIKNRTADLLYFGVFITIAVLTKDQFFFRPYEHGLTFLSIFSLVLTRTFINNRLILQDSSKA